MVNTGLRNSFLICIEKKFSAIFLLLLVAFASCHQPRHIHQSQYPVKPLYIDKNTKPDSIILSKILPYKLKLDSQMNETIIQNEVELKKELPEGSLGNFVTDQLMNYAQLHLEIKPDFCLLNHGGLRLPGIYPGPIYLRTLFELQPFENQLALVPIKGTDLKPVFDLIKEWGGAPVSGLHLVFQSGNLQEAQIQGQAIQDEKIYWILTSDYLANGGDYANILKQSSNKLFLQTKLRDALIDNLKAMAKKGQTIQTKKNGRIQFN